MRTIDVRIIEDTVRQLCMDANRALPEDVCTAVDVAETRESLPLGREVLRDLHRNREAAVKLGVPVCQDTGMAVVFAEIGQEVYFEGGLLRDAVNRGVSRGYTDGLLRCSVVGDPLRRVNTNDNTPAVLHITLTEGERVRLTVAPKGFGSENMSRIYMLTPAAGRDTIMEKVCETARLAGSNPCPPMILGVGIGGDFEMCALLAKKALCRSLDKPHPDSYYAALERDLLEAVNRLGIGPQGFGGSTTALGVNIETYPTHIAGLPLAINVGCHVTRHTSAEI